MLPQPWKHIEGDSPIVATAIHAGHDLRPGIASQIQLDSRERLREEDPYTDVFTGVAATRIIVNRSRFEVDLNRPPENAVYLKPEDAWGLNVWKSALPAAQIQESLALHQHFYEELRALLQQKIDRFGQVVILDIHSYNHRRGGADGSPAAELENPTVNIGTGSMPAYRWDTLLQAFLAAFRSAHYQGQTLDIRENVRFQGGYFPQWIHANFPDQACAIAIEFKKTFMNEWTGELDHYVLTQLYNALVAATDYLQQELQHRIDMSHAATIEEVLREPERRVP